MGHDDQVKDLAQLLLTHGKIYSVKQGNRYYIRLYLYGEDEALRQFKEAFGGLLIPNPTNRTQLQISRRKDMLRVGEVLLPHIKGTALGRRLGIMIAFCKAVDKETKFSLAKQLKTSPL